MHHAKYKVFFNFGQCSFHSEKPEAKKKEEKVNYYKELFLQNLVSKNIEAYRKTWAKARVELSRMKVEYHFAGKEESHV